MAEILDTGYISLRTLIVREWNKFILLDEEGDSVYETELKEENWIHDRDTEEVYMGDSNGMPVFSDVEYESNEELEFEVVIKGSDVGSLPVTVSSTKVQEKYSVHQRDDKYRDVSIETFSDYTFENVEDELTIKHKIKVPKVD